MGGLTFRAVGYRRVSMREQVDNFSLDAQENHIRTYVQSQGWELLRIYTDAGISAKKGSRRPSLEQLLRDAREDKFDIVVVDKIDRFYRHLGGLLTALDQLNNHGVSFASVQEKLDFTTPWGKLMLTVLGMLAEIYIDNLRQETRKGKRQRARRGLWLGSIPFGYCNGICSKCTDPNGADYCPDFGSSDKGDGKTMAAHPVESLVVKMAFDWYKTGEFSDRLIAAKLNNYELHLPDGGSIQPRQKGGPNRTLPGPFTKDIIRDMLQRVAYTGILPYQGMNSDGQHPKRSKPNEIYPGAHPALVDEESFQQVQQIRETLATNPRYKNGHAAQIYPLTNILKCGYCSGTMRGSSNEYHRYYVDGSQVDFSTPCQQATVRSDRIEQQVVSLLQEIIAQANGSQPFDLFQAQVTENEARFSRAKELYLLGEISKETYEQEKTRLEKAKNDLQFDTLTAIIASTDLFRSQFEKWDTLLTTEKKRLLRLALETAWVRDNALAAIQPSIAFLPLLGEKSCNCGEGGIRTRG